MPTSLSSTASTDQPRASIFDRQDSSSSGNEPQVPQEFAPTGSLLLGNSTNGQVQNNRQANIRSHLLDNGLTTEANRSVPDVNQQYRPALERVMDRLVSYRAQQNRVERELGAHQDDNASIPSQSNADPITHPLRRLNLSRNRHSPYFDSIRQLILNRSNVGTVRRTNSDSNLTRDSDNGAFTTSTPDVRVSNGAEDGRASQRSNTSERILASLLRDFVRNNN